MAEANKDEVDKCKQIAQSAIAAGDSDKALRFLQKAKRMSPSDASIDGLMAAAQSCGGNAGGAAPPSSSSSRAPPEGPRYRGSAASGGTASSSGATRTNKEGRQYTSEQMQLVQKILRTKDYYDIFDIPRDASEEVVKKAYKKMALKLHPDKNQAPGADEAFKKVSKAFQCLTDNEKKEMYDRYGDEERIPQQHRQHYQQDFMTPEDLFAAFFGGGVHMHRTHHHRQHHDDDGGQNMNQVQRAQLFQALPVLLLVLMTLASNFASRDSGSRFSFTPSGSYNSERTTASLSVSYYVAQDFDDHYAEGTRNLAEFERQVEIYYVRNLHGECDYQEKVMHKKVMIAKRRGSQEDLQEARAHPRPACKQIDKIKRKHSNIYRQAMYMGGYY